MFLIFPKITFMTKTQHKLRFRLSASQWNPTERKTSYFFATLRCQNSSDPSLILTVYFSYLRLHLLCPNCHSFILHQLFPAFRAAVSHPLCLNESKDRFKTCQLSWADHHRLVSVCEETRYICQPRAPFFPFVDMRYALFSITAIPFISCRFHLLHRVIVFVLQVPLPSLCIKGVLIASTFRSKQTQGAGSKVEKHAIKCTCVVMDGPGVF